MYVYSASPTSVSISKFGGFQSASLLMPSNATITGDKDSVTASKGVEYILVEDSSDSLPSTSKRLSPVELIPILTLEEGHIDMRVLRVLQNLQAKDRFL